MEVEYEFTIGDLAEFIWYDLRSSPNFQRRQGQSYANFGLAVLCFFLGLYSREPLFFVLVGVCLFLGFVCLPPSRQRIQRRSEKRQAKGKLKGLLCKHKLSISPDAVLLSTIFRTIVSEFKYPWSEVDKVVSTNSHVFIYIGPKAAFIAPRRAFSSESGLQEFAQAAKKYFELAKSSASKPASSP